MSCALCFLLIFIKYLNNPIDDGFTLDLCLSSGSIVFRVYVLSFIGSIATVLLVGATNSLAVSVAKNLFIADGHTGVRIISHLISTEVNVSRL